MATQITIETATTGAIVRNGDAVSVQFKDGSGVDFGNVNELQTFVESNAPTPDQAKAMLIGKLLAGDPLLDSPETWNARKVIVDLESITPVKVV
jgi:hypothetical protein